MRSYSARSCHVAQCVHLFSIWVVYVNYSGTTLRLYYIYAYFISERGSESPPLRGSGDDGIRWEFLYASCGGGSMQLITVRSL